MRTTFRTTFDVAMPGEAPETVLAQAAQACRDWALGKATPDVRARLLAAPPIVSLPATDIGKQAVLEIAAEDDAGHPLWALRLMHPDGKDPALHWHTELGLRRHQDRVVFSSWLYYVVRDGVVRHIVRDASRPRIVRDLVTSFAASAGLPLLGQAVRVTEAGVPEFVAALHDPGRRRPVIFVSCRNLTDRPAIDPVVLAERLAGIAHVHAATSRFPSFKLQDHLPQRLCAWDGAVRVYWPALRRDDDPRQHPLWSRTTMRAIEDERGMSFNDVLFFRLCALAAVTADPLATDFSAVEAVRRGRVIAELRSRGELAELVEAVDQENLALRQQVKDLDLQILDLTERCQKAEAAAEAWRTAYEESAKSTGEHREDEAEPTIATVAEAIVEAERRFGDQIVFCLNGRSAVKDNLFEKPGELFEVFEFLATTYFDARTGKTKCSDFDLALRERCGWSYEPHQSEVTMTKYRDWYRTRYAGRDLWLPEHAGTGSSKDPRSTFRIGFAWDKPTRKVVIGFLGQHQESDRT